jgi:mRNA interferase MazF
MKVGDLYWSDLPQANGHEQSGRRPVLVLQDDAVGGSLPTVLIIPLSSTKAAARFAATIPVGKDAKNGLTTDSVILVFQIRVLDRSRFGQRIGKVSPAMLAKVYDTLDNLTGRTRTQVAK